MRKDASPVFRHATGVGRNNVAPVVGCARSRILEGMDIETAQKLNEATRDFYAANAASFSSTRERPWEGWLRLLPHVDAAIDAARKPFGVLDVGCGNMRFEKFLAEAFPNQRFAFACIDNCPALAEEGISQDTIFHEDDVVELIREGKLGVMIDGMLDCMLHNLPADLHDLLPLRLSAAFGLMHHIPLPEWRRGLLATLVDRTAPGGLVAVAFWQFAKSEKAREKAERTTAEGCEKLGISLDTDSGDYLLGWQGSTEHFRYCHSFSDDEIDALADEAQRHGARVVDCYSADGSDSASNRYLVLAR